MLASEHIPHSGSLLLGSLPPNSLKVGARWTSSRLPLISSENKPSDPFFLIYQYCEITTISHCQWKISSSSSSSYVNGGLHGKDEVSKQSRALGGKQNPRSCVGKVGTKGGHRGSVSEDRDTEGEVRLTLKHGRGLIMSTRDHGVRHF